MAEHKTDHCNEGNHKRCSFSLCHCWCHLFDASLAQHWISTKRGLERLAERSLGRFYVWIKGTFPLTRRAFFKAEVERLKAEHARHTQSLHSSHKRDLENERIVINELLPKLIRITIERRGHNSTDHYFRRFQIITQFDEEMVYRCLQHGNSQREIEYMAEYLAHQFKREMLTLNFQRLAEADYRARQKDGRYMPSFNGPHNFS